MVCSKWALAQAGKKLLFFTDDSLDAPVGVALVPNWVGDRPNTVAVSNDGLIAAVGCSSGLVHLVRRDELAGAIKFRGSGSVLRSVCFSPDGSLLAVTSAHSVVRVYAVAKLFAEDAQRRAAELTARPSKPAKKSRSKGN